MDGEITVIWTGEEIRRLRYRMGWSQAEMARRLNLEMTLISQVEAGSMLIPANARSSLMHILNQAEASADQVHRRPIAEVMMRDQGLCQIHDLDVVKKMSEI